MFRLIHACPRFDLPLLTWHVLTFDRFIFFRWLWNLYTFFWLTGVMTCESLWVGCPMLPTFIHRIASQSIPSRISALLVPKIPRTFNRRRSIWWWPLMRMDRALIRPTSAWSSTGSPRWISRCSEDAMEGPGRGSHGCTWWTIVQYSRNAGLDSGNAEILVWIQVWGAHDSAMSKGVYACKCGAISRRMIQQLQLSRTEPTLIGKNRQIIRQHGDL